MQSLVSRSLRRRLGVAALSAAMLVLPAVGLGSPVLAQPSASCADTVTSAPTGPATVSTAKSAFGQILVIGAGQYRGCSLYLLTSDALRGMTGAPFGCSDGANAIGAPCDTFLWPALLTDGAPIAGRGVNPKLL
ncbi:MAG: hypothetical protein QOI92_2925, partial [Chloroflexota bacterium]|nr:hypothetical protein [Chloroflexota bacterium]